ncbi:hypothetical protein M2T70_04795 [Elizabethkingia anophelis]|uniref:hypothetical protein n=1 Tax=Elizabethkingia anophelis TaxID=1117645 RepID=UPI000BA88FE5|nr:hypothetical protein [Elizabethkingia anophelis]ASV77950.1 hypothetical protein A6J37_04570 [Elizabethkingia anophelis]MCL1648262.1 hypothetical protein [Elizabethkingia anophelis]MCL1683656.1 hypothetical protein [Elizabethkingia anophelis]MDV3460763.1 hypothetical protein [Elizabethkingia anophelis]MDV3571634.1 hypothetical protein [Elizabethkingia anophelis]
MYKKEYKRKISGDIEMKLKIKNNDFAYLVFKSNDPESSFLQIKRLNNRDIKKLKEIITEYENDKGLSSTFKKFRDIENERRLLTADEYQVKYNSIIAESSKEELVKAAKEAENRPRSFERKVINAVFIKYGLKAQKTDYLPAKHICLLEDLGLR